MKTFIFLGFLLQIFGFFDAVEVLLLMGERFENCEKGDFKALDVSHLSYEYVNDTQIVLNGDNFFNKNSSKTNISILDQTGYLETLHTIESPWKNKMYIEKFDRGQWHASFYNRKFDDFCKAIQNPAEPSYSFTSRFEQKECPFKAGHRETFLNRAQGKLK